MKKIIMSFALFVAATVFVHAAAVPDNVEKAFVQSFPSATEVKWHDNGDFSIVRFVKDKVITELTYDANAAIVKSVRYYYEDNLPPMVVARLKAKYPGKKVFGVTEVSNESRTEYHIVLEDETRWYNVLSDHCGNLSLASKFKKA